MYDIQDEITIIDKEIIQKKDYSEEQEMRILYTLKSTPEEIHEIYYFGIPDDDKIIEYILRNGNKDKKKKHYKYDFDF